jgi:TonB-linked SusC/RagA family outer membrane protein
VVLVEGTTTGTISGEDGGFSFSVPAGDIVLDVSNLGYIPQKVTVPAATGNITVYLQENAIQLDAAVVVGYGTQKRVNLTGAVAVVDSKQLADRTAHSVTNMLQGAVPGLNITTSNGKPGSTPAINIRGYASINTTGDPLILVDGAEGDLNRINSNDVESISIIKDASAAAVYGGRATYGVILVTTKSGQAKDGKATVRYSGRFGWEEATTSTDYENRGYWSVYTINKFWQADSGKNYVDYTDYDMQQLLARVNDKTEHPDRPWTVEDTRNGRKQWVYYGNYDWWDMNFRQKRPSQQHSISLSGGNDDVKYMVSGAYDQQTGIQRAIPDVFDKYNLRSKIDFKVNKWIDFSNNTSFYSSKYTSLGDGSVDNTIGYLARHALANFPMQNPDGSWLYSTPYLSYKVANGRHILLNEGTHRNVDLNTDFTNTSRLVLKPLRTLSFTGDFTYRFYQSRNTSRSSPMWYREYPDADLASYATGAGQDQLDENINTRNRYSANAYFNYDETFGGAHHLSATGGVNYEYWYRKQLGMWAQNFQTIDKDDMNLVIPDVVSGNTLTSVSGGQVDYALLGVFARVNYDYKGRYLIEISGRDDGTSRFAKGSRWGLFPSGSIGWRISEEPFFKPAQKYVDNLKLRASLGTLGNQNISDYYAYMRLVTIKDFAGYSFNEGTTMGKYASLDAPLASDLTWERTEQWDLGLDLTMFNNRLNFTADVYIRDTKDMLLPGKMLPSTYGASEPLENAADLRTKGYEIAASWRDQFLLAGKPFEYSVGFNLSDYKSTITKYDNPEKSLSMDYYEGMEIGEIWGFTTDGFFATDEEAKAYAQEVDLSYQTSRLTGGWLAGDLKFLDTDGDGKWGIGANTVDKPGDRKILGNSLPSFSYGINASIKWMGFDASIFFQGTGNHYWYPNAQMMPFWGPYSYSYVSFLEPNFLDKVWAEDNTDSYFPRARAYSSSGGYLSKVNDRYLQNIRYLRLKNLTVGYTIPTNATKKIGVEQIRVYFSGENLAYWSPIKKNSAYVDPEAAIKRSNEVYDNAFYPWSKTIMFGVDITF